MKKILLFIMTALLLLAPIAAFAAEQTDPAAAPQPPLSEEVPGPGPGSVPAGEDFTTAVDLSLHAVILALLNHDAVRFDPADPVLAWESLYNMLSFYGQLDDRSEYRDGRLLIFSETVYDYAASVIPDFSILDELPPFLADRMEFSAEDDAFLVTCGTDSLSEIRATSAVLTGGQRLLTGSLIYLVDGSDLVQFRAVLEPADNMFGFTLSGIELI